MKILRKFKDFFKQNPKETEQEKSNRLMGYLNKNLQEAKEKIEDLFYDFEDLGAKVEINPVYKNERTFTNGSKLHPPSDSREITITHVGYLNIKIKFESIPIDSISDDLPDQIRRCLIESVFRMNDEEDTKVESASYRSRWSSRKLLSPIEKSDVILVNTWGNSTAERVLSSEWARDYFRVKMWTSKDSDKISRLIDQTINIYTKPIKIIQQ